MTLVIDDFALGGRVVQFGGLIVASGDRQYHHNQGYRWHDSEDKMLGGKQGDDCSYAHGDCAPSNEIPAHGDLIYCRNSRLAIKSHADQCRLVSDSFTERIRSGG